MNMNYRKLQKVWIGASAKKGFHNTFIKKEQNYKFNL